MSRRLAPVLAFCLALVGCAARREAPAPPASPAAPEAPASAAPASSAELSPDERCQRGDLASCMQRALVRARSVVVDNQQSGLKELRGLCDQGLADACAHWGDFSWGSSKTSARQAFERGCSLGSVLACAHQGFATLHDTPGSPRGLELLKKACDGGSPEGCTMQAEAFDPKQWGEIELGVYWGLMTRGCQGKVARACRRLGEREARGDGIPRDSVVAAGHFQIACEGRDGEGCTHWGDAQRAGIGTMRDEKGAARAYSAACDLGDPNGCYWLAVAYEQGLGLSKDLTHAAQLLRGACKAGDHDSCARIAANKALEPDLKRRLATLDALCNEQVKVACWALAENLDWNNPTEASRAVDKLDDACASGLSPACYTGYDALLKPLRRTSSARKPGTPALKPSAAVASRALLFLERGCPRVERSPACVELAHQLSTGELLPRSPRKGAELSLALCEQNVSRACKRAADALLKGDGIDKNPERAASAYGKACDGDEPEACRALAGMARQGNGTPKDPARAAQLEGRAAELEAD